MPLPPPRADCFSESCKSGRETRRAGNSPASIPVDTDTPNGLSSMMKTAPAVSDSVLSSEFSAPATMSGDIMKMHSHGQTSSQARQRMHSSGDSAMWRFGLTRSWSQLGSTVPST